MADAFDRFVWVVAQWTLAVVIVIVLALSVLGAAVISRADETVWLWNRADNGAWVVRPDADTRCTSSCIGDCVAPPVVTCVRLPPPGLPEPR